jgi:hypothetical protein
MPLVHLTEHFVGIRGIRLAMVSLCGCPCRTGVDGPTAHRRGRVHIQRGAPVQPKHSACGVEPGAGQRRVGPNFFVASTATMCPSRPDGLICRTGMGRAQTRLARVRRFVSAANRGPSRLPSTRTRLRLVFDSHAAAGRSGLGAAGLDVLLEPFKVALHASLEIPRTQPPTPTRWTHHTPRDLPHHDRRATLAAQSNMGRLTIDPDRESGLAHHAWLRIAREVTNSDVCPPRRAPWRRRSIEQLQ